MSTTRIRFTDRIRRGLGHMRILCVYGNDDTKPPMFTTIKRWSAKQRAEYEAALAWCEQEEKRAASRVSQRMATVKPTPTAERPPLEVSLASRVAQRVLKMLDQHDGPASSAYISANAGVTLRSALMVLRNLQRSGIVEPCDLECTTWRRRKEASRAA